MSLSYFFNKPLGQKSNPILFHVERFNVIKYNYNESLLFWG